jgi:hypothetical protein
MVMEANHEVFRVMAANVDHITSDLKPVEEIL